MNILFSVSGLLPGGSETFLLRLTSGLCDTDTVVILNTRPDVTNEEWASLLLNKNVKIESLPSCDFYFLNPVVYWLNNKLSIIYIFHKLYTKYIINKYNIQLVCSFKYESDCFISSVLEDIDIPLVVSTRGCYSIMEENTKNNIDDRTYFINQIRRIFNRADGVVWLSEINKIVLSKYNVSFPLLNCQIYNGIDFSLEPNFKNRLEYSIPSTAFVFGMIARGVREKGWEIAIKAFEELLKRNPKNEIYLILVGGGEYVEDLKNKNKIPNIVFLGEQNNAIDFVSLFDIGLLPSQYESMPNVIIEYIRCGKPIIASNVGEVFNMINTQKGIPGYVIPYEDNIYKHSLIWSNFMEKYLKDVDLINTHKEIIPELKNRFDLKQCVQNYRNFFKFIITSKNTNKIES